MIGFFSNYKWIGLSIIVWGIISICLFYTILKPIERLPIYQPASVNNELVDSTIVHKINYHKISDFSLTNQNGEIVTQKKYDNKIYVADFFFTTCQSICPVMTKNMKDLQYKLIEDSEVLLLSHTVFPEIDSVEVLKKYAIDNSVIDSKWDLVTGDKKEIYDLIIISRFVRSIL